MAQYSTIVTYCAYRHNCWRQLLVHNSVIIVAEIFKTRIDRMLHYRVRPPVAVAM